MSSSPRYTEEFKLEAIKQITERGHSVADVAGRLGISTHSLYAWLKQLKQLKGSASKATKGVSFEYLSKLEPDVSRSGALRAPFL